jgi:hypothetical protein
MEYVENDEQAAKLPPVGGTLSSMEEIKQAEGFHNLTLVDEEGNDLPANLGSFTTVEEK